MIETVQRDYKSLKKAIGKQANLGELAEACVCFANAQGGEIIVGVEDKSSEPPGAQKVSQEDLNKVVSSLRSRTDSVGIVEPQVLTHPNGGQYFILKILPTTKTIATTSSGKVLIRVSDNCYAAGSDDLVRLASEKTAFQWEVAVVQKLKLADADHLAIADLLKNLRGSDRVSEFIKQKDDIEILEFYQLLDDGGNLTNLGVLWLGKPQHRARLSYPITVQYIVYNERDEKIRKKDWHLHLHSPKQLLHEIEREAVELTYTTELPDGLFRKTIRRYPQEVIRELLINAFAHKKYTISGDVFIEVYPDRMVLTNPGGLPLGITPGNILHERHRRNPHLIQLLSDLKLMEGEGSGYDLVYEKLSRDARPLPEIEADFNKMRVTVYSGKVDEDVVSILDYVDRHFNLTQKEYIVLGIISAEKKILSTQLAEKLQLSKEDKMKGWLGSLLDNGIIISQGQKKGTQYLLNPALFNQAKVNITPSLKTMEPYKLEALILEDLKYNGRSKISEIHSRVDQVSLAEVRKSVYVLKDKGELLSEGGKKNRTYDIPKKNK
jgi:ATP-dependent DNA helicase RecG